MRATVFSRRSMVAAAAVVTMWWISGPVEAQSSRYQQVESPYQEEVDYVVGTDLEPEVEVDGIQWQRFSIRPKNDREYPPAKPVPIVVQLDLENTSTSADILIIVLFEDGNGIALDRLELAEISVGRERTREVAQKHKVMASVLEATRKIYVFFEVSR